MTHNSKRELKPYAEPVVPEELREEEVYFSLQFADEELLIPILSPLVFVGRNLAEGDVDLMYFQDYESFGNGLRYSPTAADESTEFHVFGPKDINHIFDYEHALDGLNEMCAQAQAENGGQIGCKGIIAKAGTGAQALEMSQLVASMKGVPHSSRSWFCAAKDGNN